MAEPAPHTIQELSNSLTQEISQRGDEVPERYLHKDGFPEAIHDPEFWRNNMVIDLSLLSSSTPAGRDELSKLRSALSDWGCFLVINHGMENQFLKELLGVGKQFFSLPLEEKLKCSSVDDVFQGYGNDSAYTGSDQIINWNDRLFVTLYPEEKRKLQFWPQEPENFRSLVDKYSKKVANMTTFIYKAMARSLDLEENTFLKHLGDKSPITGRFNLYPRCPRPEEVLGVKPHSDGDTLTVLLVDDVGGLQVQKDDQWYEVPIVPGALFINLGDLGEVMTNGMFKSVMHRVITNSNKDRLSVAAFCTPEDGNEIGPVSELVNSECPQLYKKFNILEFRKFFFESYSQGLRTLEALKI